MTRVLGVRIDAKSVVLCLGVRMKVIPEKTIITKFQYSRSKV